MGRGWTSSVLVTALVAFVAAGSLLFRSPRADPDHRLEAETTATVAADGLPTAELEASVAERRDLDRLMAIVQASLLLALGAVGLSLAGLMGSENLFRARRWAVESLLGAPLQGLLRQQARLWRPRLTRGLVTGLALVVGGAFLMVRSAPSGMGFGSPSPWAVLAGAALVPLAVLILALRPVWSLYRTPSRLASAVRRGRATEPPEIRFRRTLLVTFQLAVGVALVTAAGLLRVGGPRSVTDAEATLAATFLATGDSAVDAERRGGLFHSALDRLRDDPTLVAESLSTPGAWLDRGPETTAANECGRCFTGSMPHPVHLALVKHHVVMPGFFANRGVDVLDGRALTAADGPDGEPMVVINQAYARAHFQDGPAVGKRLALGGLGGEWHRVVGVVSDVPRRGLGQSSSPFSVYFSALQHPPAAVELIARVAGEDPPPAGEADVAGTLDSALAGPDLADLSLVRVTPASGEVERLQGVATWLGAGTRGVGWIAGLVALLAVWAAVAGHVRSRAAELGTRAAVGAAPRTLIRLVLAEAGRMGGVGVALGLWGATAVVGLMGPEGGRLFDPLLFSVVGGAFLVAAVAAALPGALEAGRVEPARALAQIDG